MTKTQSLLLAPTVAIAALSLSLAGHATVAGKVQAVPVAASRPTASAVLASGPASHRIATPAQTSDTPGDPPGGPDGGPA